MGVAVGILQQARPGGDKGISEISKISGAQGARGSLRCLECIQKAPNGVREGLCWCPRSKKVCSSGGVRLALRYPCKDGEISAGPARFPKSLGFAGLPPTF